MPQTGPGPWPLALSGTALIGVCYGLARFAYGLFVPQLRATFALEATVLGWIGAGSYIGYGVAIVASLLLTDRLGARRVAVSAGGLATTGMGLMAVAPGPGALALGVVLAGASTGAASPPLAAAVTRWIREPHHDRVQTVVNAGTGIGVLVSGPVALAVADRWRLAWAGFAVVAALVTLWVAAVVPGRAAECRGSRAAARSPRRRGTGRLVASALIMGMASAAVWTFGREVVVVAGMSSGASSWLWVALGAAGVAGALGDDLARRLGQARTWTLAMLALAGATLLLGTAAGAHAVAFGAAAAFGAAYIVLTGVLLVGGTRVRPHRPAMGVGTSFLMIAVGQAAGAPLAGRLIEALDPAAAFACFAGIGLLGAAVRPLDAPTGGRGEGRAPGLAPVHARPPTP